MKRLEQLTRELRIEGTYIDSFTYPEDLPGHVSWREVKKENDLLLAKRGVKRKATTELVRERKQEKT